MIKGEVYEIPGTSKIYLYESLVLLDKSVVKFNPPDRIYIEQCITYKVLTY